MDQTRAINGLAPFLALAKSANSARAAADLVTQATSAANTFVFVELLRHPNIQALAGNDQYAGYLQLLQIFSWGTWESYKASSGLPQLSDAQTTKLRLLSLLTIASEKVVSSSDRSNLGYASLCARLGLSSSLDLEHLVIEAIYNELIAATLNPVAKTVVVTSVAPLRDLAPGSVQSLLTDLEAWSSRCNSVLTDLEAEIQNITTAAERRAKRQALAERQIKSVTDSAEKSTGGSGGQAASGVGSRLQNTKSKRESIDDEHDGDGAMDIDRGQGASGGKKKASGLISRLGGGRKSG